MTTNNPTSVSGETIRMLRTLKGMKQTEAAKKLGISQQAYSKMELNNIVSESKLVKILRAFNSSLQDLEHIIKFTPPINKINAASFII